MKEPFEAEVLYNSDGGEIRKIHPTDNGEIYFSTFKRGNGSSYIALPQLVDPLTQAAVHQRFEQEP